MVIYDYLRKEESQKDTEMKIYQVYGWRDGYDVAPASIKHFESKPDAEAYRQKLLLGPLDYAEIQPLNLIKKSKKVKKVSK